MRAMRKIFRKEYLLVYVSIAAILYALFLNIFYPLPKKTKTYGSKNDEETK